MGGGQAFNFLQDATPERKFNFGVFMWAAFYVGYFIFCLNWIIFSNLKGDDSSGWISHFKDRGLGEAGGREIRQDAVNYSITLARGAATIGVAWIMAKLSHKRASLLAFGLNTAALPLIFSPHYALLVLGRMLMATGGTMLIILIQPVISRFFDLKAKGILSSLTPTAYLLAAFVANVIFVYEADWIKHLYLNNWRMITGICAGLSFVPFFSYMYFGRNFSTSDDPEEALRQQELPENTYSGIIKERSTWFWAFFYSFLLVASLMVSLKVPDLIEKINKRLICETFRQVNISWKKLYICIFYAGCVAGMCWGRWAKTRYQRKPAIALCCGLGLLCWAMIFGFAHLRSDVALATMFIYLCVFYFAFFAMGIQAVIMYVPHEYRENNNAKRITIFFAYLWGIGYIIYTIYQIIVTSFMGMDPAAMDSPGAGATRGTYVAMGLITAFVALYLLFSLTIKEPRPEYKFFPGLDRPGDIRKYLRRSSHHHPGY